MSSRPAQLRYRGEADCRRSACRRATRALDVALLDSTIARLLPSVPRPLVERISRRYIAGPTLADACRTVARLNAEGREATVDVLGEEVRSVEEALAIEAEYRRVLETIEAEGLSSNVSVKLTALGLKLDFARCRAGLEAVVSDAAARSNFVRIDMEDSSATDETLELYSELRGAGHENLGVVLQASLRRTVADVRALAPLRPNVRLTKGIYVEPPAVAFGEFEAVRANFVKALEELLAAGCYVGIATHDEWLIGEGLRLVQEHGLERDRYEFQMLLGVREELGETLVRDGHRLRIYVPFGEHWYEYSLRRLQENPRVGGYIAADTVSRMLPGGGSRRPSSSR